MKISIRPAVTADHTSIEAASRTMWDARPTCRPAATLQNGWDMLMKRDHEKAFGSAAGQPIGESSSLFVADANGGSAGFTLPSWHLREDTPIALNRTVIDIWVHVDWRNSSLSRKILEFAKGMADSADWDNPKAQVWTGAPSVGRFETAGFPPQHVTWRYGPDRPARSIPPREKNPAEIYSSWKWPVAIVFIAIVSQA